MFAYFNYMFTKKYRLNLVIEPQDSAEVQSLIKSIIPSSKVIDESGGSLVFAVPLTQINELGYFFKYCYS